jgi:apolipoprotein N-acyltransferase
MFPLRQGCLLSQAEPLIQIASIFGIGGVTLQALILATLVPLSFFALAKKVIPQKMAIRSMIVVLVLTTLNAGWGALRVGSMERSAAGYQGEKLDVLIVQGETEHAQSHANMVKRSYALKGKWELVLWPECSLGRYHRDLNDFSDEFHVSANSVGINYRFRPMKDPGGYLLAGGYSWLPMPDQPDSNRIKMKSVSAYLLDSSEKLVGRHDKIELMAGGEYLPGEPWLPALVSFLIPTEQSEHHNPHYFDNVKITRGVAPVPIGDIVVGKACVLKPVHDIAGNRLSGCDTEY